MEQIEISHIPVDRILKQIKIAKDELDYESVFILLDALSEFAMEENEIH